MNDRESLFPDAEPECGFMVFDYGSGNAVGAYDLTPETLRRVSAEFFSHATVEPSPFLAVPWAQEELRA